MTEEEPQHLRVLVADERQKYLEPVSAAVRDLGHEVIAHEVTIARVAKATEEHRPDVAIVAVHEDTDHALGLVTEIVEDAVCPVIALADDARRDFVAAAARAGVFAYIDSTNEAELQGAIDVALQRYREYRRLLGAFDRRARIERAKGMLMERHGLADQEAFERIRTEARSARRPLIEVVDDLLGADGG
ncbi:MAG: two-component system, response regulator PdtaR [Solirubrobacteraceae bacterium]|jgi:response regulator NasT|nr:two-component system, response regulator PdtaR [Solirubrobacteraceae bacterium]